MSPVSHITDLGSADFLRQVSGFSDGTPLSSSSRFAFYTRSAWVQFTGELFWILSEITWILLLPEAAIPAGTLALFFVAWSAGLDFKASRHLEWWCPAALQAFWLLVNNIWMMDEVLWDDPDEQTPWAQTPMIREDEKLYNVINGYCALGFSLTPVLWILAVLLCMVSLDEATRQPRLCWTPRARGLFWQAGHTAMWSAMDSFWSQKMVWLSMASCIATIAMILANAAAETGRPLSSAFRCLDRTDAVWILWTLSNAFWILLELVYKDRLIVRYLAAAVGLASLLLLSCCWEQFKQRMRQRVESLFASDLTAKLCDHDSLRVQLFPS